MSTASNNSAAPAYNNRALVIDLINDARDALNLTYVGTQAADAAFIDARDEALDALARALPMSTTLAMAKLTDRHHMAVEAARTMSWNACIDQARAIAMAGIVD